VLAEAGLASAENSYKYSFVHRAFRMEGYLNIDLKYVPCPETDGQIVFEKVMLVLKK
jgi:hypothetical protein